MEDDPGQARLLQKKLRRLGYEVEVAPDGQEGMARYGQGEYEAVIVDHKMPYYDGLQVIRLMREQGPLPPVVMLTATGDESLAVEVMKQGAGDYLVKDIEGRYLDLLPAVLENLLETKRLRDVHEATIKALRLSEEKFRAIFEHAPIGMALCDEVSQVFLANDAFCEALQLTREEALREDCRHILTRHTSGDELPLHLFKEDSFGPFAHCFRRTPPDSIWLQVSGAHFTIPGQGRRLWLFVENFTERKQMQEQLMQVGKFQALGELTANIIHEVNNPLGIISAKARLLLTHEKESMSPKVERELGKVIQQCDRLSDLTRGLLNFSRPSLGMHHPIVVGEPLRRAASMVAHKAKERDIALEVVLGEEPLSLEGSSQELEQVFLNLLLNAIEAMPEGGTIHISAQLVDENPLEGVDCAVCVRIKDGGQGIPAEALPHIFDPFFSTKAEGKGTGLGLSICFGLVRSHKGTILVDSLAQEGTTFHVFFPALGPANESESR